MVDVTLKVDYNPIDFAISVESADTSEWFMALPVEVFGRFVEWLQGRCWSEPFDNWICLCRIFGENTYGFLASDHPEPVTLCNLVIAEQHWDEFVGQMVDRWQDQRDRVVPETNRMVMEGFTFKEARNCVDTPSTSS